MKYKLDASKQPSRVDFTIAKGPFGEGETANGILKLKNGELSVCYEPMGGDSPKEFEAKEGSGHFLFHLKRANKK